MNSLHFIKIQTTFKLVIVFSLTILFSLGCSKTKAIHDIKYEISFDNSISTNLSLNEIADSLSYVFIQFDINNPVGRILLFKASKKFYYLVDHTLKLLVIGKNGVINSVINNPGRGPSEYSQIDDIIVSENEELIYILDTGNKNILKFSISGTFLKSYPLKLSYAAHFSFLGKNNFCIYQSPRFSHDCENIFITDSVFNIERKFYYEGDAEFLRKIPYLVDTKWYHFNNNIYFKEAFQDTVYEINEDYNVKPYLCIDFGKKRIPDYFFEETKLYQNFSNKFYQLSDILESKNYIFLRIFFDNINSPYLYIKNSNSLLKIKDLDLINIIDFKVTFWPNYIDDNDNLYAFYYSNDFLSKAKSIELPEKFLEKLKTNTNPIIVRVSLKPNRKPFKYLK
jgi:hypothetical protein